MNTVAAGVWSEVSMADRGGTRASDESLQSAEEANEVHVAAHVPNVVLVRCTTASDACAPTLAPTSALPSFNVWRGAQPML